MSGDAVIPPPADLQPRMNYPQPWLGGRWTFADVVDYHHLAAAGLLEAAAGHRAQLVRGFAAMNRRTIDRFSSGGPFAFIVPRETSTTLGAAAQLVSLVQAGGGRVQRATAPFVGRGRALSGGDDRHPASRSPSGGGSRICSKPSRTGCALALAVSAHRPPVRYDRLVARHVDGRHASCMVEHPSEATLATLDADQPLPRGRVSGTGPISWCRTNRIRRSPRRHGFLRRARRSHGRDRR